MKKNIVLVCICALVVCVSPNGFSQVEDPADKVKKKTDTRVNKNVDETIDNTFDEIEDGIKGLFKKKKKKKKDEDVAADEPRDESQAETEDVVSDEEQEVVTAPELTWAKFDFVPGDKVIFEDGPAQDEENGEFPSKWDLYKGQIEIAELDGETVIMFRDGAPSIVPYLKNSDKDYLPEVFTIEFDFYRPPNGNRFCFYLHDRKNQKKSIR